MDGGKLYLRVKKTYLVQHGRVGVVNGHSFERKLRSFINHKPDYIIAEYIEYLAQAFYI